MAATSPTAKSMRYHPPLPGLLRAATRIGAITAAAALGMILAACGPRAGAPAAGAHPPLRIAVDLWAGYYPLVIAAERGYLRDEKVEVDIQFPQDTHRMIADFAAHRYDVIGVSLADVILTTRVKPDIRMILNSDESAGADMILGNIPLRDAGQVRHKRIGTTMGGFGELFVRRFVESQGLNLGDVILMNVDAANVPDMLKRGEIDIGHTWDPYAAAARAAGAKPWFSSSDTPGLIVDGLMVHAALVRERAEELHGLTRAWFRAVDWWKAHAAEGNALVERRLKLPAGSVSWAGIKLLDRADNRRAFARGAAPGSLMEVTGLYVEFFISRGTLSQRLRPEDLLEPRFIEE